MGIFDFFKKKNKYNHDEILEDTIDIKDINEEITFLRTDIDSSKEYFIDVNDEKEKEYDIENKILTEFYNIIEGPQNFKNICDSCERLVKEIGVENIDFINKYMYEVIDKPDKFNGLYNSDEEWNIAVKNIVLTSLYCYKEVGVDYLLKIAIEPNKDGLKAINLLCKLASNKIDVEKIVDSIIYIIKDFEDNTVVEVLKFLSQIKGNFKVKKALEFYYKKYIIGNQIEFAYDCVLNSINLDGKFTRGELIFLKAMALSEEPVDISLFLNHKNGKIDFSSVNNDLRIKAAITFYSLHNKDEEINIMLKYVKETSEDENLRKYLAQIL